MIELMMSLFAPLWLAPLWHAPTSDSAWANYLTPLDNPTPLAQILEKTVRLVMLMF